MRTSTFRFAVASACASINENKRLVSECGSSEERELHYILSYLTINLSYCISIANDVSIRILLGFSRRKKKVPSFQEKQQQKKKKKKTAILSEIVRNQPVGNAT